MHASLPPDALPPDDDEREPDVRDANVVDSGVLAERRAQRAESSERTAVRRAADAQSLAAELARERARLEAERDAARAEAAAAREGADAVIAEAAHLQAERDELRAQVEQVRGERDELHAALEQARARAAVAPAPLAGEPAGAASPSEDSPVDAEDEAVVAEPSHPPLVASGEPPADAPAPDPTAEEGAPADAEEPPTADAARDAPVAEAEQDAPVAEAVEDAPAAEAVEDAPAAEAVEDAPAADAEQDASAAASDPARALTTGPREAPITALALERERSNRLRAQLEAAIAAERELREQVAALEQAMHARRDAEQRIEGALARVRAEFDAAREAKAAAAADVAAPASEPAVEEVDVLAPTNERAAVEPAPAPVAAPIPSRSLAPTPAPVVPLPKPILATQRPQPPTPGDLPPAAASGIDAARLNAARERLRAEPPAAAVATGPDAPAAPWLPAALRTLAREDAAQAGRILVAMLPAQGLVTQRVLRYDVVLAGRGALGVDVEASGTRLRALAEPRPRREVDVRIATDEAGLARLLLEGRGLRRRARVRGRRRRVKELRRLAAAPLALRDLAAAGALHDPVLALTLAALAIEPTATYGHRFTVAHAPAAGGPADVWLRIRNGERPQIVRTRPPEAPALTIRSTRGGLLPLLVDVPTLPGEHVAFDGDADTLALLREWIARTEYPQGA